MKKKINSNALVGYTGFVGKNLRLSLVKEYNKLFLFNSKNIRKIKYKKFDKIYFAGLPATKWLANKHPKKDLKNIELIKKQLKFVECNLFILISTIDIYNSHEPYGYNRKKFEEFIISNFKNYLILRLPALFGKGLKKNIIYDLLNKNQIEKINLNDQFQWFDVSLLRKEIKKIKKKNKIIELYSAPISNKKILEVFKGIKIKKKNKDPIKYNFKPECGFYKSKKFILNRLRLFVKNEK